MVGAAAGVMVGVGLAAGVGEAWGAVVLVGVGTRLVFGSCCAISYFQLLTRVAVSGEAGNSGCTSQSRSRVAPTSSSKRMSARIARSSHAGRGKPVLTRARCP